MVIWGVVNTFGTAGVRVILVCLVVLPVVSCFIIGGFKHVVSQDSCSLTRGMNFVIV